VLGAGGTLQTSAYINSRHDSTVRTLPLTTDFGDTKERQLRIRSLGISTQATLLPTILPASVQRAAAGVAFDLTSLESRYHNGPGEPDRARLAEGDGSRIGLGAFAHLVSNPDLWLRWTVGGRVDVIRDQFNPAGGGERSTETHFAFSPKAGVNIRFAGTSHSDGRLWMSASSTFKTPTPDQLFDQRPIPFPPSSVTISNPDLRPQRGFSAETGIYHEWTGDAFRLSATLTLYSLEMRNELDFDLQSLKYVNIGKSRHRGAEAGLNWSTGILSGFASVTTQDVVARAGDNVGRQLKAVPGEVLAAGLTAAPGNLGTATVSLTRTADMYIDDANTRRIPDWTRVDAQVSRSFTLVTMVLGARSVLDERINGTGFLDPAGSGTAYFYPAAGRALTLGIRLVR
jgi:hypothetical protein